jgi:acyl carrier protein
MKSPQETIRQAVTEALAETIRNAGREAPDVIFDSHSLSDDLQLDSLDFAVVVVQLEQRLGMDPFRQAGGSIRTVGELVERYLQHHA